MCVVASLCTAPRYVPVYVATFGLSLIHCDLAPTKALRSTNMFSDLLRFIGLFCLLVSLSSRANDAFFSNCRVVTSFVFNNMVCGCFYN